MQRTSARILTTAAFVAGILQSVFLGNLSAEPAVRIAVVDRAGQSDAAALLTAHLTAEESLVLLEREAFDALLREQELAGFGLADGSVRTGQLLKAEAILLLESREVGEHAVLESSLIHVNLGLRLRTTFARLPLEDSQEWAADLAAGIFAAIPRLQADETDAIPISLLGLRSPIGDAADRREEVNANILLRHHLSRHPNIFVLERWGLDLPAAERRFVVGEAHPQFTLPTTRLQGEIRISGEEVQVTIDLTTARSGGQRQLAFKGSVANLSQLIEDVAREVIVHLDKTPSLVPWSQTDEAGRFAREARSASDAGMWPEALEAALAARALGTKTLEDALLLLDLYFRRAFPVFPRSSDMITDYASREIDPAQVRFPTMLDTLEHLEFELLNHPDITPAQQGEAAARTLLTAGRMLRFALESDYTGEVDRREDIRRRAVFLFRKMEELDQPVRLLENTASVYAPYWFHDDKDVLALYEALLRRNVHGRPYTIKSVRRALMYHRDSAINMRYISKDYRAPWLRPRPGEERAPEAERRWTDFITRMANSTDFREAFDGHLLRYFTAVVDPEERTAELIRMKAFLRENWERLFTDTTTIAQVETFLNGEAFGELPEAFRYDLMMHYAETAPVISYGMFAGGFKWPHGFQKEEHAANLLDAMEAFLVRLSEGSREPPRARDVHDFSHRLLEQFPELASRDDIEPLRVNLSWGGSGYVSERSWFRDLIYREGRLWTLEQDDHFTYIVASRDWINKTDSAIRIRIPSTGNPPFGRRPSLDVDAEGIAVAGKGWVAWYAFATREWQHFEVPESEEPLVRLIGGELYYAFPSCPGSMVWSPDPSGILRIDRSSGERFVLASSRRRPARNVLDDRTPYKVIGLFADNDGRLHASISSSDRMKAAIYRVDEATGWKKVHTFPGEEVIAAFPVSSENEVVFQPAHGRWHHAFTWNFSDPPRAIIPERGPRRIVEGATASSFRERRLATRDGEEFWLLVEKHGDRTCDLWLYHYADANAQPIGIPLRFGSHERANAAWNARLIAAETGLVIDGVRGSRWLLPFEKIEEWLNSEKQ